MEWISVKERLPIQMPEGIPTYDWVLVTSECFGTNEPWPFTIGRFTKDGWDFWDEKSFYCPCFGDTAGKIDIDEITHWMPIPKPAKD